MKQYTTERGFQGIMTERYPPPQPDINPEMRLVQQSSAIGDYPDSMDKPGSSFLWVGDHLHINREQVAELIAAMARWLETGKLF